MSNNSTKFSHNLKIYYQNVRGLNSKTAQVKLEVASQDIDIIVFTETFLKEGNFNYEIFDCETYEVFRRDRDKDTSSKGGGGGVLIAVKKSSSYRVIRRNEWENPSLEDLWIQITPTKGTSLLINVCYLPKEVSDDSYETHFAAISERVNALSENQIVLLGDYNAKDFCEQQPSSVRANALIELMDTTGMTQSNCHRNPKSNNLLDLIFTNFYHTCEVAEESLSKIDDYHPPLVSTIKLKTLSTPHRTFSFRPFKKINFTRLNDELASVDWANELETKKDINEAVEKFYAILTSFLDLACPIITKKQSNEPRWIKRDTLRLKREKRKAHARWKRYKNGADYDNFRDLRNKLQESVKRDHDHHIFEIESNLQNNPQQFWKFVNEKRSNGIGLAEYITWEGEVAENKKDVASLFMKRFGKAFSDASPEQLLGFTSDTSSSTWNSQHFPLCEIYDKLKALKINKSAGPDALPPILFKKCATSLTFPLFILYNSSLRQGVMPDKLKIAHIVPIFKSGSATNAANYRPVAKLSVIAKIFDSLIADELLTRFSSKISIHQHGFFRRRSIVTNLAAYTEYIEKVLDKGGQVDTIFTDFSSAFDKVPHDLLIKKLNDLGIGGTMINWFSSYLKGRKQRIQVGDQLSDEMCVPSSVIQGSHSGPILFALFVNDLTSVLDIDFTFFADDLKLYIDVKSTSDCEKLQKNLTIVHEWSVANGLQLNIAKCVVVSFTRRKIHSICHGYQVNDQVLARKSEMRDLGIIYDAQHNRNAHISAITRKANQMRGFVLRNTTDFKDVRTLKTLYTSLVRSHLETATEIWNSLGITQVRKVEKVQHKFLRHIARKFFNHRGFEIDYEFYEKKLDLHPLALRRLITDVKFVIKSFTGKIDSQSYLHLFNFHVPPPRSTRNRTLEGHKVFSANFRKSSIFNRLMKNYNNTYNDHDSLNSCKIFLKSRVIQNYKH